MAQVSLSAETIHLLDGGTAGELIDVEIGRALADLDDRGAQDKEARKVVVVLIAEALDNGDYSFKVEAEAKLPKRKSRTTFAKPKQRKGGEVGAVFQAYAPDDPNQRTIDEAEERNRDKP